MSQLRSPSYYDSREPHSVSLKVLRLSRPSLSTQQPLPISSEPTLTSASYAYPRAHTTDDAFLLAPILTLPPTFGSAYVGETFSCTLCANNELAPDSPSDKAVSAVRIDAEMKTPSAAVTLDFEPVPSASATETQSQTDADLSTDLLLAPGGSVQQIVNFALSEAGSHVLAVTVTYSETLPTSGRVRSFRKLYQFVCKNTLLVRTKASAMPTSMSVPSRRVWALEAQLENCGEDAIVLTSASLETLPGLKSQSLNLDVASVASHTQTTTLMPADVIQVCYLVTEETPQEPVDGKLIFGSLSLHWRGSMGIRGFISTEALGAKMP